ncbi:MAG: zinc ribbon domain-containing protein [Ignavibacteriales bacterium]|nr:MAG: zinc ribbon domain-containing protein [Ignavibacteriales bacterium]
MPLFEYKCTKCSIRFEILHKSVSNIEEVKCPECHSTEIKKLLSSFSAAGFSSGSDYSSSDNCDSGSCGCSSGYCGMN